MKNILNRAFYPLLVIIISFNCSAQTYSSNDFVKIPVPVAEGAEWLRYNQSMLSPFAVSTVKGELKINKWEYTPTNIYRLPEGTLLAIDMGEFGGGLYYKPDDSTKTRFYVNGKLTDVNAKLAYFRLTMKDKNIGKGKYLEVCGGHVAKFFTYRDSLYYIDGLDHMGFDHGSLCRVEFKGDSFNVVKLFSFDDSPHAVCVYKDKILIATFKEFYVIENWHKELIFDKLFWYGFNPESITVDDNENVYVGMFGFYAKIDLIKRTLDLYSYAK